MLNIQQLDPSHIPECLEILTSNFETPWKELKTVFEASTNRVYGACIENRVVGFVAVSSVADEGEILMCAVAPLHHQQGVATALVERALNDLKSLGVIAIFLEVDIHNVAAQRLYQKLGFQTVGHRRAYYRQPDGSYHDAVVMRLAISA
jgi:ribosomal-protein-alanine N-acetyltransferase